MERSSLIEARGSERNLSRKTQTSRFLRRQNQRRACLSIQALRAIQAKRRRRKKCL